MLKKVLFFGNEQLATGVTTSAPTLRALIKAGYEITNLVIAQRERHASRKIHNLKVVEVAHQHGIPVLSPNRLIDAKDQLASSQAEVAVLVAYGKIIPSEIIGIFPKGIINIHPSLLPRHRGPTPIESVILNGEKKTGTSLMQLSADMDSGPLYDQQSIEVYESLSKQMLANILLDLGRDMLIKQLPSILDGSAITTPQSQHHITYDKLIVKTDGVIDWRDSAEMILRKIRAYKVWPRSRLYLDDLELIVTEAHIENDATDFHPKIYPSYILRNKKDNSPSEDVLLESKIIPLAIQTSNGILAIDKVIPAGRNEMSAGAFLSGYRNNPNNL